MKNYFIELFNDEVIPKGKTQRNVTNVFYNVLGKDCNQCIPMRIEKKDFLDRDRDDKLQWLNIDPNAGDFAKQCLLDLNNIAN